jgi:hypothetical protein
LFAAESSAFCVEDVVHLFLNFTYAVTTVHNSSALLSLCGCVAKYLFRREICSAGTYFTDCYITTVLHCWSNLHRTTRHELPDSEIPQRVLVLLKSPASSILYIAGTYFTDNLFFRNFLNEKLVPGTYLIGKFIPPM